MPEARTVTFTEDDLEARASYDEFEPGEYDGVLVDVKDVTANSGNTGLRWIFQVLGLNFSITTWDRGAGGWKLAEVLRGLGEPVEPGKPIRVAPDRLLGRGARVKIGYESNANRSDYLTVLRVLPSNVEMPSGNQLFMFDAEDDESDSPYAA